jgi:hypothetical protein
LRQKQTAMSPVRPVTERTQEHNIYKMTTHKNHVQKGKST